MFTVDPLAAERELTAGGFAFVVGKERVIADRRRERALGEAEDHDEVEIETDPHRDRCDE
jgi:hypothetical protein